MLTSASDTGNAESQFIQNLADKSFLKKMYVKLCNYFQIAYGEGINEEFAFNLNRFCNKYDFPALKTYIALQFLDRQGIITLSQSFSEKITMQFLIESREVIRYTSLNSNDEEIILAILRTYPGIYEMKTPFNLQLIAKKSNSTEAEVHKVLEKLKDKEIIEYNSKNNDSFILFNEVREDDLTINRVSKYLEKQNNLKKDQLQSVLDYVNEKKTCKSKLILDYFGEKTTTDCGICSYCITKKVKKPNNSITQTILDLLKSEDLSSRDIQTRTNISADDVVHTLQELLEDNRIIIKSNNKYTLK